MLHRRWSGLAAIVAVALMALAGLPHSAVAWGGDGHRTVAQIAVSFLTPKAAQAVSAQVRRVSRRVCCTASTRF
jgi:hypothetical protein